MSAVLRRHFFENFFKLKSEGFKLEQLDMMSIVKRIKIKTFQTRLAVDNGLTGCIS